MSRRSAEYFHPRADQGVVSPERTPKAIAELRLIVHPFFAPDSGEEDGIVTPTYREARQRMFDYLREAFSPQSEAEVTLLMPVLQTDSSTEFWRETPIEGPSCRNLYTALKGKGSNPENVLIVPDIGLLSIPPQIITETLAGNGFMMTDKTRVTLGGEWVDACVPLIAKALVNTLEVENLRLDKRAVIGSSAQFSDSQEARKTDTKSFAYKLMQALNTGSLLEIRDDDDFVYGRKEQSSSINFSV